MKTIVFIMLVLFLASCDCDKSKEKECTDVPEKLTKTFQAQHPDANKVYWEKEGEYYAVEFKENRIEKEVVYDIEGNIVSTETEIPEKSLPSAIQDYVSSNYDGFSIDEAVKEKTEKGIFYEIEIESKDKEFELEFDGDGNFIKKKSGEDDGDDEGEADDDGEENEDEEDDHDHDDEEDED